MTNREFIANDLLTGDFTEDEKGQVYHAINKRGHYQFLYSEFTSYERIDRFYKEVLR